jgi:ribonuclease VapC
MSDKIKAAVVDSSALICIAKSEPAAPLFMRELTQVQDLFISAATLSEVLLATMAIQGQGAVPAMEKLIASFKIKTVDYMASDVTGFMQAAQTHHVKASPPGLLNMGDLFSFQLATKMGLPLFFQGIDFLGTPVKNAMKMRGYAMTKSNKGVPAPHQPIL